MPPPTVAANGLIDRSSVAATASAFALALALASGCSSEREVKTPRRQRVWVRSFTEATAVRELAGAPPFAFAATAAGLDRWDLRDGKRMQLTNALGQAGFDVAALDYDAARRALWLATPDGLARYDVEHSAWAALPAPPRVLGIESFAGATLGAAADGGVWIGLAKGLFYAREDGSWTNTGVTAPITDLLHAADGTLWIGTQVGLFVAPAGGAASLLGRDAGCDLASVRFLVAGPEGGALVVGENQDGQQRVVLAQPGGCDSYRVSPARTWQAAAARPGEALVLTDHRVYRLARPWSPIRRLARDGMRLLPTPRKGGGKPVASPFVLSPVDVAVPTGARALAAVGDEILIGTDSLGTLRLDAAGDRKVAWLRSSELVAGARELSVACRARDDCYLATGGGPSWHFDGEHFRPTDDGDRPLIATVVGAGGKVLGLRQGAAPGSLNVAEAEAGEWHDLAITIETPGVRPELAFARVSPAGVLWLGLRYRDDANEVRPFGVALVDVGLGLVAYHHASVDSGEAKRGILPIPISVVDVGFIGEEAWLATSQGVAQVKGEDVKVYSEAEGLVSEILRGVACSAGGMVYVGSRQGIGTFDGERWSFPRQLGFSVNDLAIGKDGRLWIATDHGLVVFDGARVRRLDARRGLLEDEILDLALDSYGRLWLRGPQGIGLVSP